MINTKRNNAELPPGVANTDLSRVAASNAGQSVRIDNPHMQERSDVRRLIAENLQGFCDSVIVEPNNWEVPADRPLNLTPTESKKSPASRAIIGAFRPNLYLHARPNETDKAKAYPGIEPAQRLYQMCVDSGKALFGVRHLLPDYASGMAVMQNAILTFSNSDDIVLSVSPKRGGHELTRKNAELFSRRSVFMDCDLRTGEFDLVKVERELDGAQPAMIYVDATNSLVPYDLTALRRAFPDACIIFDGSQVLGLIAGNAYPNPLEEGADVLVGSTHKTLYGPIQGVAMTNDEALHNALQATLNITQSNNNLANLAALTCVFEEYHDFGAEFARRLIDNANKLGRVLAQRRWSVVLPDATSDDSLRTQHVWAAPSAEMTKDEIRSLQKTLEASGITTLAVSLELEPGCEKTYLRLGTLELTQRGAGLEHMWKIALALEVGARYGSDRAQGFVDEIKKTCNHMQFCFSPADIENFGFIRVLSA